MPRGYSITPIAPGTLRRAADVAIGDPLRIVLEEGELRATVESASTPTKGDEP